MRLFKLAGRNKSTGSSSNIYSYDVGVRRSKRHFSLWLLLVLPLLAAGVVGYLKVRAANQEPNVAFQPAYQVQLPSQVAPSKDAAPANIKSEPELEAQIDNWGQQNSRQKWSIVVQQITGGNIAVNYRASSQFHPSGMEAVLSTQTLMDNYAYATWNQPLAATGQTINGCVTKMLEDSDKNCTKSIGNLVGWSTVNSQLKKMGLTTTDLTNLDSKWHTTASDIDLYLNKFYLAKDTPAKKFILNLMNNETNQSGIPDGSSKCKIYDKAGQYNNYLADGAIVVCPKTTYSLVVLSQGGSFSQVSDLAKLVNKFLTD